MCRPWSYEAFGCEGRRVHQRPTAPAEINVAPAAPKGRSLLPTPVLGSSSPPRPTGWLSVSSSSGVVGAFGVCLFVPKGTGPCCQNVFLPSLSWTGRQIFPVLLRSKVASTSYDFDFPAARFPTSQLKALFEPLGRSFSAIAEQPATFLTVRPSKPATTILIFPLSFVPLFFTVAVIAVFFELLSTVIFSGNR